MSGTTVHLADGTSVAVELRDGEFLITVHVERHCPGDPKTAYTNSAAEVRALALEITALGAEMLMAERQRAALASSEDRTDE